jgi:hypothetical protein
MQTYRSLPLRLVVRLSLLVLLPTLAFLRSARLIHGHVALRKQHHLVVVGERL